LKNRPLRILLIEDNPGDARLVREMLSETGAAGYELTWVKLIREGREALDARPVDVVLADLSLPDSRADQTFAVLRELAERAPVVIFTGLEDEEAAARAVREGAQDYLVKGKLDAELLARAVRYAIERWRFSEELRSKERELEQLNTDLSAFAHTLSHDLRVPLANASGYAQTLKSVCAPNLGPEEREWCDVVIGSLARMNEIIEGMLEYNRLLGRPAEPRQVGLKPLVVEVLVELDEAGLLDGMEVETGSPLPAAWGDPSRIRNVLSNLLSNAAKYGRGGPGVPRIEVGCREEGGETLVYVADNGAGIAPEDQWRIFEPPERGREAGGTSGYGLGLAICRRAVESWGGRIWVESEPGEGSIFLFTLPLGVRGGDREEVRDDP
jgi:signal transduction histidine kinase